VGFIRCYFLRCPLLAVRRSRYRSNRALRVSVADPYDRLFGIAFRAALSADACFKSLGASNWQPALMGLLDTGAFALSNRGMQMEQISIVTVLSSLYGAVTVLLAAIFLRERIALLQWAGIVAIFVGIVLIGR